MESKKSKKRRNNKKNQDEGVIDTVENIQEGDNQDEGIQDNYNKVDEADVKISKEKNIENKENEKEDIKINQGDHKESLNNNDGSIEGKTLINNDVIHKSEVDKEVSKDHIVNQDNKNDVKDKTDGLNQDLAVKDNLVSEEKSNIIINKKRILVMFL